MCFVRMITMVGVLPGRVGTPGFGVPIRWSLVVALLTVTSPSTHLSHLQRRKGRSMRCDHVWDDGTTPGWPYVCLSCGVEARRIPNTALTPPEQPERVDEVPAYTE